MILVNCSKATGEKQAEAKTEIKSSKCESECNGEHGCDKKLEVADAQKNCDNDKKECCKSKCEEKHAEGECKCDDKKEGCCEKKTEDHKCEGHDHDKAEQKCEGSKECESVK